jgi:sugar lactone lactonase YvrE
MRSNAFAVVVLMASTLLLAGCTDGKSNSNAQVELPFGLIGESLGIAVDGDGVVYVAATDRPANKSSWTHVATMAKDATRTSEFVALPDSFSHVIRGGDGKFYGINSPMVAVLEKGALAATPVAIEFAKEDGSVNGIVVDGAGDMYIASSTRILLVRKGSAKPEALDFPSFKGSLDIALGGDGDLYVLTHRYEDAKSGVTPPQLWRLSKGATDPTMLDAPNLTYIESIAIGTDGDLYVAGARDADSGGPAVLVFTPGEKSMTTIPFEGTLNGRHDIAIGPDGDIYVTDDNRVFKVAGN